VVLSGPALRVGGDGGPFAASHLLAVCLNTASSVLLATGPPAPPTRSRGVLRQSLAAALEMKRRTRADAPPGRRVDVPTIVCAAHLARGRGPSGEDPTAACNNHERHGPAIRA